MQTEHVTYLVINGVKTGVAIYADPAPGFSELVQHATANDWPVSWLPGVPETVKVYEVTTEAGERIEITTLGDNRVSYLQTPATLIVKFTVA